MTRRLPVVATLLVLAAVAVMIRLGFWQLDRADEKAALLARFTAAAGEGSIPLPKTEAGRLAQVYRPASTVCARVESQRVTGGKAETGQTGWIQVARCRDPDGVPFAAAIGWSQQPAVIPWRGGPLDGRIANAGTGKTRLIAHAGLPGTRRIAPPDPANVPNNHLSYAVQWFLFAAVALVIYGLALRRRLAAPQPPR